MLKKISLSLLSILILCSVCFVAYYKFNENKNEIINKNNEIAKLSKINKEQKEDIAKVKEENKKLSKKIETIKNEQKDNTSKNLVSDNQIEENIASEYTQNTTVPITEYKVPTNEDMEKYKDQNEEVEEQNQPIFATATEDEFSIIRFAISNGISMDDFYNLNPGVSKIEDGESYRIK